MKILFYFSMFLVLIGCQSVSKVENFDRESYNSSQQLFLELWNVFDENYAFFELRNVDWKAEKEKGLEQVKDIENDKELFDTFCNILKQFDDAHINLESDSLDTYCNAATMPSFYKEFPTNESFTQFLNARNQSLRKLKIDSIYTSETGIFQYGNHQDWSYLRVKRFYGADLKTIETELNMIISGFRNAKNIIIDNRVNPGGNDETALLIASYFYQQRDIAFVKQVRNGNDYEDFSPLDTTYIESHRLAMNFENIYLLTNQASGSSADVFALIMAQLSNTTIIGTNTEGIFSDMYRVTLSNNWRLTLSNERYYGKNGKCYEGVGVPVDYVVENKMIDVKKGKDLLIEKVFLQKKSD